MRGLTRDCIVEMTTRKVKWLYAIVTLIMIGSLIVVSQVRVFDDPARFQAFGTQTFEEFRSQVLVWIFDSFIDFLVVLTVLITAGKFPTMLVPGRAEFYLSKPLSRTSLFLNRFWGMFVTYGGLIALCGLVGYLALFAVSSYWSGSIIHMFILHLISLAIWLSITSFGGVVLGSTSSAIVTAGLVWFAQLALRGREFVSQIADSALMATVLDVLYYIVPKTGELSAITTSVALRQPVSSWMPLYSSILFALALMVVTAVIFNRKNY